MNKYKAIVNETNKLMNKVMQQGVLLTISGKSNNPMDFIEASKNFIETTSNTLALNTYLILDLKNIINSKDTTTYENLLNIFEKKGININEFMIKFSKLEIKTMAMLALNLDTKEKINETFSFKEKYYLYHKHFNKVKEIKTYEGSLEYLRNLEASKTDKAINYANYIYENNIAFNVSDDEYKVKYLSSYIDNVLKQR